MALGDRVHAAADDDPDWRAGAASRFRFSQPRHFTLPAILLLLSEEPSYGYRSVQDLENLAFGHFDRPVVYRTLGRLKGDALDQVLHRYQATSTATARSTETPTAPVAPA